MQKMNRTYDTGTVKTKWTVQLTNIAFHHLKTHSQAAQWALTNWYNLTLTATTQKTYPSPKRRRTPRQPVRYTHLKYISH